MSQTLEESSALNDPKAFQLSKSGTFGCLFYFRNVTHHSIKL